MPYKLDPLPAEKIALDRALGAGRGASTTATSPGEDWTVVLREEQAGHDPRGLSRHRADHGAGIQPRRHDDRGVGLS